jgi:hypothetical protein
MRESVEVLQRQSQQQLSEVQKHGAEVLAEIEKVDNAHK